MAQKLASLDLPRDTIVLGLARGGVPVAAEVARALELELDVFVVRKLGLPYQRELAFGAIASGGVRVLNDEIVSLAGISEKMIDAVTTRERRELRRREKLYRGDHPPPDLEARAVVLVDDGLATGATMAVSIEAVEEQAPASVIAAVPVAPRMTRQKIASVVDEIVCLATPEPFVGVGAWFDDFGEVDDDEVRRVLKSSR